MKTIAMKTIALIAAAVALAAVTVRAEEAGHMEQARKDLESARAHLRAADHDYAGHRREALELVERAIGQVQDGIKVGDHHDARDEHKVQELQHKEQRLEHRIDKLER
jgi:uncharacterized protein Yka (UPF0111/DUF47 family)